MIPQNSEYNKFNLKEEKKNIFRTYLNMVNLSSFIFIFFTLFLNNNFYNKND